MESNEYKIVNSGQQNQPKPKKVGHSKFYDVTSCIVTSEKQDIMKPEDFLDQGINYCFFIFFYKYYILMYIVQSLLYCRSKFSGPCTTRMYYFQWCNLFGLNSNKCTKI